MPLTDAPKVGILLAAYCGGIGVYIFLRGKAMRLAQPRETVLAINESADYRNLSKLTLYHFAHNGQVPGGSHWRFHKDAVEEWIGMSNRSPIDEAWGVKK